MVEVIDDFSSVIKGVIDAGLSNRQMTPEIARDLKGLVDKLNKDILADVSIAGRIYFTLEGLKARLKLPDELKSFYETVKAYSTVMSGISNVIEFFRVFNSPASFENIGLESKKALIEDFGLKNVHLNAEYLNHFSIGAGSEVWNRNFINKMILKIKNGSFSMSLRASDAANENADAADENDAENHGPDGKVAELSVENIFGKDKFNFYLPHPYDNAKVDAHSIHQFACVSGSLGLQNPKVTVSALFGVEEYGVGGQLRISTKPMSFSCKYGLSFKKELISLGLTCTSAGLWEASYYAGIKDSSTAFALSVTRQTGAPFNEAQVILGVLHAVDRTLSLKARVGTDYRLSTVVKKKLLGTFSVKGCAEVDFRDFWRPPRVGVFFSYP